MPDQTVHTIWCPPGWTPEQTWEHISRGQRVPTDAGEENGRWVNVQVTAGRLVGVLA